MTHPRTQLRDAVRTALIAGVPAVSGRVNGLRQHGRNAPLLPALEVSTPRETVERLTDDGVLARDLTLTVSVYVSVAGADPETAADEIAEAVEAAVLQVVQTGVFAYAVQSIDTDFEAADGAEARTALMVLTFGLSVHADEAEPSDIS